MTHRSDGRYVDYLLIDGKRKYFYGSSPAEVKDKLRQYNADVAQAQTFSSVADAWALQHYSTIAYNTTVCYEPARKRASEYFADTPITDVTPAQISALLNSMKNRNFAAHTVKVQLIVINLIFVYAAGIGLTDDNPALSVKPPKMRKPKRRTEACDEQITIIIHSCDAYFGLFAFTLLYTGLRRNEALALKWEDIDFENETININKSLEWTDTGVSVGDPKTEAGDRVIPLLPPLKRELLKRAGKSGYIFTSPKKPCLPVTKSSFVKLWKHYCGDTGVNITPHQLRHTFATFLFESDTDEKDAQEILGHSSIAVTKDIYTHIREQKRRESFDKIKAFTDKM